VEGAPRLQLLSCGGTPGSLGARCSRGVGRGVGLDHITGTTAPFFQGGKKRTLMRSVSPPPKCPSATLCQLLPADGRGDF